MKRKGKHPVNALTDIQIRRKTKPGLYADGNGLYLVVDRTGGKRWILRTVIKGKRHDLGLGGVSVVSLADARQKAMELRGKARAGGDPLAERRQLQAEQRQRRLEEQRPTFRKAASDAHELYSQGFENAKHKRQWLSVLEKYMFPFFGDGETRIDLIRSSDVHDALEKIWVTKPETARRVKQRTRKVFVWAKAKGHYVGDNPVDLIDKDSLPPHEKKHKHHRALPYSKLPEFIEQLRAADDVAESVLLAFEFAILCASRTREVLRAEWTEIDMEAKTWVIPAKRMKAGEEHKVPLSGRCIEILKSAKIISDGGKYVFPGGRSHTHLNDRALDTCLERMKRTADCTVHGFRSTFRDWCSERARCSREVSERALAHTIENKTEASYARSDLFELRKKLMDQWSRFATAAPAAKVVRMARA